ncbi:MAG: NADase-type glycan-binding domain-containing protein [Bacteroidales bacterium]
MPLLLRLSFILFPLVSCTAQPDMDWEKLHLRSVMGLHASSSELEQPDPFDAPGPYGAHHLMDQDFSTAWSEGVEGPGPGEYVYLAVGKVFPERLYIANGYQKSPAVFEANNRVKTMHIRLYAGFMIPGEATEVETVARVRPFLQTHVISLADQTGVQEFILPFNKEEATAFVKECRKDFLSEFASELEALAAFAPPEEVQPEFTWIVQLEIKEIYPGSRWDDTCLSEVWTEGKEQAGKPLKIDEVQEVYASDDGNFIYVKTNRPEPVILVDRSVEETGMGLPEGQHLAMALMDVSSDRKWAQVNFMVGQEGGGRVEETSRLYYVPALQWVEPETYGNPMGLYGFGEKDGKTYLITDEGGTDLSLLKEQLNL